MLSINRLINGGRDLEAILCLFVCVYEKNVHCAYKSFPFILPSICQYSK